MSAFPQQSACGRTSCHYGSRVSKQGLNDLTQFYLLPIKRGMGDSWVGLMVYSSTGIMELTLRIQFEAHK